MNWFRIRRRWWLGFGGLLILGSIWAALPWVYREDAIIATDANTAAFSPTQSLLAIATNDGIRFWRAEDPQPQPLKGSRASDGAPSPFRVLLAWSADGHYLATDGDEYGTTIEIWDTVAAMRISVIREPPGTHAEALAFSPDGTLLVIAAYNELQLWRWHEQPSEQTLDVGRYTNAVFSADGQYVITESEIWRVRDSTRILRGYELGVGLGVGTGNCVAASPTTMVAAFCSYDGKVVLIDLTTMQLIRQFRAYQGGITALAFSPDGRWLAVGSGSYEAMDVEAYDIRMWSVADGQLVRTLQSPTLGDIQSLSFSANGQHVVATTRNRLFGVQQSGQSVHIWALH
jgi:WD40 repeat protein